MVRTILETLYLSTLLYLIFLYIKLFQNVIKIRRRENTPMGCKSEQLRRAIRAHSNFIETVPIALLLSFFLFYNNLHIFCLPSIILLAVGRRIHSNAISSINENLKKRVLGMKLTVRSIYLSSMGIVYYLLQLLYYTLINYRQN